MDLTYRYREQAQEHGDRSHGLLALPPGVYLYLSAYHTSANCELKSGSKILALLTEAPAVWQATPRPMPE